MILHGTQEQAYWCNILFNLTKKSTDIVEIFYKSDERDEV